METKKREIAHMDRASQIISFDVFICFAKSVVYFKRGFPNNFFIFLFGIPLEPFLAGIIKIDFRFFTFNKPLY